MTKYIKYYIILAIEVLVVLGLMALMYSWEE